MSILEPGQFHLFPWTRPEQGQGSFSSSFNGITISFHSVLPVCQRHHSDIILEPSFLNMSSFCHRQTEVSGEKEYSLSLFYSSFSGPLLTPRQFDVRLYCLRRGGGQKKTSLLQKMDDASARPNAHKIHWPLPRKKCSPVKIDIHG